MNEYYLAKRADCDSNQVTVFDETTPKALAFGNFIASIADQ